MIFQNYKLLIGAAACLTLAACSRQLFQNPKTEDLNSYKIAYNVLHDQEKDDYEVFAMNPDGTGKKNISNSPGVDWVYYAWKDKVYFISDRDTCHRCYFLYETNAEGGNIRKVTDYRLADSWMGSRFNGKELIIRPWGKLDSVFYIINIKTGKLVSKVNPGLPYQTDPIFSPDGKQIVFRGSHSKFSKDRTHLDELFIINADGTGLRQLTTYPATDSTAEWHNYHAGPPFWEQDGNFISYISKQNGKYTIFAVKADGKTQRMFPGETMSEGWHAWSPAGGWIAVEMKNGEDNYDIYLMKKDGTGKVRLTDDPTFEQAPVFVRK
jgi:TolB protein